MYQKTTNTYFRNIVEFFRFFIYTPTIIGGVIGYAWKSSKGRSALRRFFSLTGAVVAVLLVSCFYLTTGPFAALIGFEPKVHGR